VASESKTLLKAFTCSDGDDAYFVASRDMGVEHDGDEVLDVFKNHQLRATKRKELKLPNRRGGDEGCSSEATQC
jgi:hypothetical protein